MARVKRGVTAHRRHKKVLSMAKGRRGTNHSLYRRAHESMLHALKYAKRHRHERKGDLRRLWVLRINAASREHGLSYSRLMHGLRLANVAIDRKMLADLAYAEPEAFAAVAGQAKTRLETAAA
ncbi:MAG: 50S ribosomal protein L20 [Dehalococcoidia bacterium]|nr:50S ribosomal protein L20 [Dehalococcoidia bacterium]